MKTSSPSITPQLAVSALASIITQAVAFGILNAGVAQTIIASGGIIIPAVFALAVSLHLGQVHAAQINTQPVVAPVAVVPVRKPAPVVPAPPAPPAGPVS